MEQTALERLAAILSKGENGYRDSPLTEATELRRIIGNARPDLYELMAEDMKKEDKQKPEIKKNSLAYLDQQKPIELDSYLPKPKSPYQLPKRLENRLVIPHEDQIFVYHGKIRNLKISRTDIDYFWGSALFTKYLQENKIKKNIKLFPPRIEPEEIFKDKKLWEVSVGDWSVGTIVFSAGNSEPFYYDDLTKRAKTQRISLPQSLVTAVFSPIDQKLKELYSQITNSA